MRGVRHGLGPRVGFLPSAGPGQQHLLTSIHLTFPTHPPSALSICQNLHSYSSPLTHLLASSLSLQCVFL